MDGDDYQSHNVDTIRTVPCDASFSLSGTLLVALRPLFGWNMDLSARLFLWDRRRCRDSLEIRAERFAMRKEEAREEKMSGESRESSVQRQIDGDGLIGEWEERYGKKKKKRVSFNRHI